MRPVRLLSSFLLLGTLAACDGPPPEPPTPSPPVVDPALSEQLESVKARILADGCFRERPDVASCDWGDFPFDPGQFSMRQDTGEAILIIDGFPALPPRAIRYKNRIKGYFRVDSQGTLGAVPFTWRAPVTLFHALSTFATPEFRPAEQLRALREPLASTYGFLDAGNARHGSFVLSLLVEANPHQPLVLLDTLSLGRFAAEEFCDASGTPDSTERLRAKVAAVAVQLRSLMQAQGVRFVNLSSGVTLESMRQDWNQYCEGPRPDDGGMREKLKAYSPIYEALFNTPGVFTAQAGIAASSPEDNPYDFPSAAFPNRLRVGYFTSLDSGLDEEGLGPTSQLQGWPDRANVDVYVNTGVLPSRPFEYSRTPWLQVDGFGVDIQPITFPTTSWVAPLALSRFINLRYADFSGEEMSDALIARILGRMVPPRCEELPGRSCVYQDPLRHGRTEAVRLQYRPREFVKP